VNAKRALRLLMAEDERDTVLTLGVLLRSEGFEVRVVRAGENVLATVAEFRPDAVLLDIGLPDRSGYDVAKDLRKQYGDACPVLIAVTAYGTDADKYTAKMSGFHHHVAKPYDPQALISLVASVKPRV
jgi:DNA-binding response OmpR family regulator